MPTEWVELKTSATPRSDRDIDFFHAKLLKFWAQSYLIGVSRVVVGFRSRDGILESVKEMHTADLPGVRPRNWDADVCVDFMVDFLQCEFPSSPPPSLSFSFGCHIAVHRLFICCVLKDLWMLWETWGEIGWADTRRASGDDYGRGRLEDTETAGEPRD